MRVFITALTAYRYPQYTENQRALNIEECNKFMEGLRIAESIDKCIVFTNSYPEKFASTLKKLPDEERKRFLGVLDILKKYNTKMADANLADFEKSYENMYTVIKDFIESHISDEDIHILANLSCGHKLGAFALYMALLNVVHSPELYPYFTGRKNTRLTLRPYHIERGIVEELPVINYESNRNIMNDAERFLNMNFPVSIDDFKRKISATGINASQADKIIMYLKNSGYIIAKRSVIYRTKKGDVIADLLSKLQNANNS